MWPRHIREVDLLRQVGRLLVRVPLNTTTPIEVAGRHYLKKRRQTHAPLLVPLANWYAARIRSPMRILTGPAWLRYERLLYDLLLERDAPSCGNRALLLPRLPGRNLRYLLQRDPGMSGQGRLGLKLAATELARIHACWTPHPLGGGFQPFSHADATTRNVLVNEERQEAAWIDFETTHSCSLPAQIRHADDLLTLLGSAAAVIQSAEMPELCAILFSSYGSTLVWNAMTDLVHSWEARPTARRLCFPDLEDRRWHGMCAAALPLGSG
jgi:hypothetical protein